MATTMDLGGPGAPCSAGKIRRLLAGELPDAERAKVAAHLFACERCRAAEREIAAERVELARELPFEEFASGVAERLARNEPARARLLRWAPLFAAACILIVAVPVALRDRGDDGVRTKGGAALVQVYVKDSRGVHAWQGGEGIPESADVLAEVKANATDRYAAAVLLEGGEAHAIYSGPAHTNDGKRRVLSFGWTGRHDASLYVQLSSDPLDVQALAAQARAGATSGKRVEVVRLPRAP